MNEMTGIPQGWRCPICKRVYSPLTAMCFYCGHQHIETNTDRTVDWTMPQTITGAGPEPHYEEEKQ